MKKRLILSNNILSLKTIEKSDIELLRLWKNVNRNNFFHKDIISKDEQDSWYKDYSRREDDYMFIIHKSGISVGCIGFRRLLNCIDLYNLIIDRKYTGRGYMIEALNLLIEDINRTYKGLSIIAKVLKNNKAIEWYLKNNFFIKDDLDCFYIMELRK